MRFAIVAASTLLASSVMGAVLVTFGNDPSPEKTWTDSCDSLLKGQTCGYGVNGDYYIAPRAHSIHSIENFIFKSSVNLWVRDSLEPSQGRGWCVCQPKVQYSYARQVVTNINDKNNKNKQSTWVVLAGEGDLKLPQ